jgi:hypothetical protein
MEILAELNLRQNHSASNVKSEWIEEQTDPDLWVAWAHDLVQDLGTTAHACCSAARGIMRPDLAAPWSLLGGRRRIWMRQRVGTVLGVVDEDDS